ncbi:MAG: cupin [Patescibacteria group bacterium]
MRGEFLHEVVVKPKPWGREIWFAWTPGYAGKILEIKKGHRFSLQYHEKKTETQLIIQGKVQFTYGQNAKKLKKQTLKAGQKVDIFPGMIHRMEALEETVIFEVSSPELDDIVKLADDYGRTGKGNNDALDKKLAKKSQK